MKPKEILVIDDSDVSRLFVRKILEGGGFSVRESIDLQSGLASANEQVPHLIILDWVMPEGSGLDFLQQRSKLAPIAHIPVIVLSGMADKNAIYQAIALGASDYVAKPADARILLQKVRKVLLDHQFQARTFSVGERPKVTAHAQARILNANEVGFLLEAPIRIAPNAPVKVTSPLLDELGCAGVIFHKTGTQAKGGVPGQYLNEIAAVGLSDSVVKNIRKITRGW